MASSFLYYRDMGSFVFHVLQLLFVDVSLMSEEVVICLEDSLK